MSNDDEITKARAAVEEAEAAERTAHAAWTGANNAANWARSALARAHAAHCPDPDALTASALAEAIADAAREHGADCGSMGRAETTGPWLRFRKLLAALTDRAGRAS